MVMSQARNCMKSSQNIIKHSDAVFEVYTPEMKRMRHNKILTGLPDTYGRGRIVGDYRRVALYGMDYLIEEKQKDFAGTERRAMRSKDYRIREELAEQIKCLKDMKALGEIYGFDISRPAKNAKRSISVVIFCISCSDQDTERCSNVRRYVYLLS